MNLLWFLMGLPTSWSAAASLPPNLVRTSVSTAAFVSPSTGTYATLEGTIQKVSIDRNNVFDPRVPGENWWPFLIANKIHIQTKEHIIRREVLLKPGDPWDPLTGLETERNLRATDFIRKAEIIPKETGFTRRIDLRVRTQDSWTLLPQLSVGTEGGDRYFIWGVEENNILGYGKQASAYHAQVGSDIRNEFRYHDPQLNGSRYQLTGLYGTTPNGNEIGTVLDRPFYSLETPYALQALWTRIIQEDTLFQNADKYSRFLQNFRAVDSNLGLRIDDTEDPVQRVHFGTHYERDVFLPTSNTAAGTLPANRELSGPILGYSVIQPRYTKETFIDKMGKVEDYNLGNEFSIMVGAMMKTFGSDLDRWTLNAVSQQGLKLGDGRFLLGQAGVKGRLHAGDPENAIFYANMNIFWKTWLLLPQTWVSHFEWNATRNLDGENQIILGGNTGLRGYKNNSFTGARSFLLNFEDRVFLTHEYFHLFTMGGVAFYELGKAAPEGGSLIQSSFKSDVGFGLRVGPTRSTSGTVLRVDAAYALNSGPGPSRWVVSLRGGQAFNIFNSSDKNVIRTPVSDITDEDAGVRLRRQ